MSNSKTNAFFDSINSIKQGKSVGQLLVIAEQCLDSAIYMAGRGSKQQREIMTDIADAISELRETKSGSAEKMLAPLKLKHQLLQHQQMVVRFHKELGD